MPLVGPGEDEHTRTAFRKDLADLPLKHLRLPLEPVPPAVKPDFRHYERLLAGQVLEASKICLESFWRLQINVEAHEVREGQIEVFRGRIVDVCHQRSGVLTLGDLV